MAAWTFYLIFAKIKFGGDANHIWHLPVALVCKKNLVCWKSQSGLILILFQSGNFGILFLEIGKALDQVIHMKVSHFYVVFENMQKDGGV